jgi:hypothetical protein
MRAPGRTFGSAQEIGGEPQMTDFRIGDKVRYIGPSYAPPGLQAEMVGEICHVDEMTGAPYVQFEGGSASHIIFDLSNLVMVEQVQRTTKYKSSGTEESRHK